MSELTERAENCSSCGKRLKGIVFAAFQCPNCGETALARCWNCKNQSIGYECPECGFLGP
ncbi:MAG: zinc finger domain-containing protein [Candidatus Thermoplasmatota archaeon]|nr:zinc finger domain-containing protein [Candidatus Thermoplasmatota archaeon]MDP7264562.1 zinc finger domain-containing protein [Candidatus Thermoplasmatota archaeon]